MKLFVLVLTLTLAAALAAHADFVVEIVEQYPGTPATSGGMVLKGKGDQARIDVTGPAVSLSCIFNVKTGELVTLLHARKKFIKVRPEDIKRKTEELNKAAGFDLEKMKPSKATGIIEKVGEWEAEIYEYDAGGATGKIWAAKDFPHAQVFQDAMKILSVVNSSNFQPQAMGVSGTVVKSDMKTPNGPSTSTLVKCAPEAVSESEFVVPVEYEEIKTPQTKPAR